VDYASPTLKLRWTMPAYAKASVDYARYAKFRWTMPHLR